MARKSREKTIERARNILLVLFALGIVVVFFNLDIMNKGESVFSRSAERKLRFQGAISQHGYSEQEVAELVKYIKKYNDSFDHVIIDTSIDDSYRTITQTTEIAFEIHIRMMDGTTISTPTRRASRKGLTNAIIAKMTKDMRAYLTLKKQGKDMKSFINTM